jgi:hypothetical protein
LAELRNPISRDRPARKFWDLSPSIFLLNLIFHVLSLPVRERGLKPPSTPGQDQAAGKKGFSLKDRLLIILNPSHRDPPGNNVFQAGCDRMFGAYRLSSRSLISAFISRISLRWLSIILSASFRTRGSAISARSLVRIAIEWCGIIAFI